MSARRLLVRPAVVAVLLLLVAAALAPVATAADGSVAPRLAWRTGGWDIDLSPDGELAAVVQHTNLQVRRAATGEVVAEAMAIPEHRFHRLYVSPYQVAWSPAGDRIAAAVYLQKPVPDGDGPYWVNVSLWAWDGTGLRHEGNITIGDPHPSTFAWSPNGRFVAALRTVWDAATRTVVTTLDLTGVEEDRISFTVGRVRWSPTGDVLFFAYSAVVGAPYAVLRGVAAWNVWAGGVVWYRDDLDVDWDAFAISPDGTHMAILDSRGALRILNASTGEVVATRAPADVGLDRDFAFGVAWSSDGRVLYVGGGEAFGTLLTYPSLDLLAILPPASKNDDWGNAFQVVFSSDDSLLALGNYGFEVYVFELTSESPALLAGGILIAGGGAAAVGYGWRRRRRRNTTTEEGEP